MPRIADIKCVTAVKNVRADKEYSVVDDNLNVDLSNKFRHVGQSKHFMEVYLLPTPLRRYLLHADEYESWWELRRQNKIFAIAASF